jgi:hypothetical protein
VSTEPFVFNDALKRALDADRVPPLPADFADRVIAARSGRVAPLLQTRAARGWRGRWRSGRRLVIGALAGGALATAAAATGLLGELGVDLPSPRAVWSAITREERAPASPEPTPAPTPAPRVESEAASVIEGPIDTPEELEEAFRRIDEARANRREDRRERVDERLDQAIDRRRAQGLPAPGPEEEARLRQGLERLRERTDERLEQRSGEERKALRRTLEETGEVTREDLVESSDRLQRLRQMPPAERSARLREWRERREERLRERERDGAPSRPLPDPQAEPPSPPPL